MDWSIEIDCRRATAEGKFGRRGSRDEVWSTPTDNMLGRPEVDEAAYLRGEVKLPVTGRRLPGTRHRGARMRQTTAYSMPGWKRMQEMKGESKEGHCCSDHREESRWCQLYCRQKLELRSLDRCSQRQLSEEKEGGERR